MSKGRLEERFIHQVRNSIDISVGNTGYPITGHVITTAGLATRKQLRIMERKGLLQSVTIQATEGGYKGQVLKAYYTEDQPPLKFLEQQGYTLTEDGKLEKQTEEAPTE